jgi:hypothetical protein
VNTLLAVIALLIAVVDITFRVKKHNDDKKSRPVVEKKVIYLSKDAPPPVQQSISPRPPPTKPPPMGREPKTACPYCGIGTIKIENITAATSYKFYSCGTVIKKASVTNSTERSITCIDNERKLSALHNPVIATSGTYILTSGTQ